MNTVRNTIKGEFTIVPNALIQDESISPVAFKIWCYMASRPDDWNFRHSDLCNHVNVSDRRTLNKYIEELESKGWLSRERNRNESGQMAGYDYLLHEPEYKKCTVEPVYKNCTVQNLHTAKIAGLNNKDSNKQRRNKNKEASREILKDETFQESLKADFPGVNVPRECATAYDWLLSKDKRYKNYTGFMRNWLRRVKPVTVPGSSAPKIKPQPVKAVGVEQKKAIFSNVKFG